MMRELKVGDTFRHQRTCASVTPLYYAAASGDFNPIHIDPEVGKAAGLGGVILQGLCSMAWAVEGFANYLGDPSRVGRVQVRFALPVRVGDTIVFDGKVISVDGQQLVAEISAKNQNGEDVLKNCRVAGRIS